MAAGRVLGTAYLLERQLGRGASGQVWAGRDRNGHPWAFKVLHPELASDPAVVDRFIQERRVLASIRHDNVVGVHDLVIEGDTVAIVMDLVRGHDLRQVLRDRQPLPPWQVAAWGADISAALHAAHQQGVIHRDVKPENVLLDSDNNRAHLSDFGIAKLVSGATRSTMMMGTPQYMAPEIAEDKSPTPATDLYSLGIVLYELCCGVAPFAGRGSAMATLRAHAQEMPGRPDGLPDAMWNLIRDLTQKSPSDRPQTALEVTQSLTGAQPTLVGIPAAPWREQPPPTTLLSASPPPPAPPHGNDPTIRVQRQQAAVVVPPPAPALPDRKKGLLVAAGVAAIGLVAAVSWIATHRDTANASPSDPTTTVQPAKATAAAGAAKTTTAPSTAAPNALPSQAPAGPGAIQVNPPAAGPPAAPVAPAPIAPARPTADRPSAAPQPVVPPQAAAPAPAPAPAPAAPAPAPESQMVNQLVSVSAGRPWTSSGVTLAAGDQVRISANGRVKIGESDPWKGPDGNALDGSGRDTCSAGAGFAAPGLRCWSLVGRVGSGSPFTVWNGTSFTARTGGTLWLGVNDDYFGDNSGAWSAGVSVCRGSC